MDTIYNFLSNFWKKIAELLEWVVDTFFIPFRWILDGFFWIIGHAAYWIFDGILTAIQLSFSGLDFSAVLFSNSLGSNLNPVLTWFIVQLGLPQCFSLVGVAIGIRMLLNLLPAAVTRI